MIKNKVPTNLESLLIISDLNDRLKNTETALDAVIDEKIEVTKRAESAESERDHWKANHDNMVQRNAVLSQRPDLPVDRLPAIREYERMLAEKDIEKQQMLNAMDSMTKAFKKLEVKLADYELQLVRCDCLLL